MALLAAALALRLLAVSLSDRLLVPAFLAAHGVE